MLKSEAERVIRRALEESEAEFTEEQIEALCLIITKIASVTVEEALSAWRPGPGGKSNYFA
jgi:hypothetical protein